MPRKLKRNIRPEPIRTEWLDAITATAANVANASSPPDQEPLLFFRKERVTPVLPLARHSAVRARILRERGQEATKYEDVWSRRMAGVTISSSPKFEPISKPFPVDWHSEALKFLRAASRPFGSPGAYRAPMMRRWHDLYIHIKQDLCSEKYESTHHMKRIDAKIDEYLQILGQLLCGLSANERICAADAIESHQQLGKCRICYEAE